MTPTASNGRCCNQTLCPKQFTSLYWLVPFQKSRRRRFSTLLLLWSGQLWKRVIVHLLRSPALLIWAFCIFAVHVERNLALEIITKVQIRVSFWIYRGRNELCPWRGEGDGNFRSNNSQTWSRAWIGSFLWFSACPGILCIYTTWVEKCRLHRMSSKLPVGGISTGLNQEAAMFFEIAWSCFKTISGKVYKIFLAHFRLN